MPISLPGLVSGILQSNKIWFARSEGARFEAEDIPAAYAISPQIPPEAQAARAAQVVADLARKLHRLAGAYGCWPVFEPGAYFDLHASHTRGFCRVEETSDIVRVRLYADLLLPSFRDAERDFVESFLPAYHAASGTGSEEVFSQHLRQEAAPRLAGLLDAAQAAIDATLTLLSDEIDVLTLLGGLEERIQHRPPPGTRVAAHLPMALQRMPRAMPTLTLDMMFPHPEGEAPGKESWIRFQRWQGARNAVWQGFAGQD